MEKIGTNRLGGLTVWTRGRSGYRYYYAHLRDWAPLEAGQMIAAGTVIGTVGNTGNAITTPPHLHFQIHPGDAPAIDPYPILVRAPRVTLTPEQIAGFTAPMDANFPVTMKAFVRSMFTADADSASRILVQRFWYTQSLAKLGIVTGGAQSSVDHPQVMFDGSAYFTDGLRHVLFLSETPVSLDDMQEIYGREYLLNGAGP